MKKIAIWYVILLGMLMLIPSLTVYVGGFYDKGLLQSAQYMATDQQGEAEAKSEEELIGVLAKVITPDKEMETLKAQAVMMRTYQLRRKSGQVQEGEVVGLTQEQLKNLWQKDYDKNYDKLKEALVATKGQVMYYNGELIEPVYHQESAGYTRDGKSLYKVDIPYLKPVESRGDGKAFTVTFSKAAFIEKLKEAYPQLQIDETYLESQIQIIQKDESGYIESLQIGNLLFEAESFRKLFNLPSTCFSITHKEGDISFEGKGIGHGVGLSQVGADALAKEGQTYEQILKYYFTGIEIKNFLN